MGFRITRCLEENGDHGAYIRTQLRTCCARIKANRSFRRKHLICTCNINLIKCLKQFKFYRFCSLRAHLFLSYHVIISTIMGATPELQSQNRIRIQIQHFLQGQIRIRNLEPGHTSTPHVVIRQIHSLFKYYRLRYFISHFFFLHCE